MELNENSDEIIIRYAPIKRWISGGVLLLVFSGLCLWLFYLVFVSPNGLAKSGGSDWLEILLLLISAAAVIVFISAVRMLCSPLIVVNINKKTKSIDILRHRFYGKRMKRLYFTQIGKFKTYKLKTSPAYFLALAQANRKMMKLKIPLGGKKENSKLIRKINKFIKSAT